MARLWASYLGQLLRALKAPAVSRWKAPRRPRLERSRWRPKRASGRWWRSWPRSSKHDGWRPRRTWWRCRCPARGACGDGAAVGGYAADHERARKARTHRGDARDVGEDRGAPRRTGQARCAPSGGGVTSRAGVWLKEWPSGKPSGDISLHRYQFKAIDKVYPASVRSPRSSSTSTRTTTTRRTSTRSRRTLRRSSPSPIS